LKRSPEVEIVTGNRKFRVLEYIKYYSSSLLFEYHSSIRVLAAALYLCLGEALVPALRLPLPTATHQTFISPFVRKIKLESFGTRENDIETKAERIVIMVKIPGNAVRLPQHHLFVRSQDFLL